MTDDYRLGDVAEAYFYEQLDRQVFWILRSVPELLSSSLEECADKNRANIVFTTQMTSFHMFCFYKLFLTEIIGKRKSTDQLFEEYENNLCKLTNKEENYFQAEIFKISKNVVNFSSYFKYVGFKERSEVEVLQLLKNAIKNSERKEYHNRV